MWAVPLLSFTYAIELIFKLIQMKLAINVIYAFSVIDLILLVGFPPSNIRVWGNINLLIKGILVSSHLKKKGAHILVIEFFCG